METTGTEAAGAEAAGAERPDPAMAGAGHTGWRDGPQGYGRITRALHWAMAALILWQLLGMALRLGLGRTPLVAFFVGLHAPLGTLLFVLILLRLGWALASRGRRPPLPRDGLGVAARAGHAALYLLMLAIPGLGLLRAWGSGRGFSPFGLPLFPATGERVDWAVAAANLLHGVAGWLLLALVAGHVLMVVLHEALWRDGTLARMAGGGRRPR